MYSIQEKTDKGLNLLQLRDDESGTMVKVIPQCGGILHSFSIEHSGKLIDVIDSYVDIEDFQQVESGGFKSCKLSPFVCRLRKGAYHFGESSYKIDKFFLGEHAIHGLLYDSAFEVCHRSADENSAAVSMLHQYRATDNGYPFLYDCEITYKLSPGNMLTVKTTITNKDKGHIPISDGWHPYFTFGKAIDQLQLEFQSKDMLEFDADLLPTGGLLPYQEFGSLNAIGSTQLDNCFTVNFAECQPMLVLRDSMDNIQLEIRPGKSYPYLQIYTPPHRQSIAIENLSSAPDAFNNGIGLITLAPGAATDFETTYKLTTLN